VILLTYLYKDTYKSTVTVKKLGLAYIYQQYLWTCQRLLLGGRVEVKKNGLRSEGGKEELKPQPMVLILTYTKINTPYANKKFCLRKNLLKYRKYL
jgi:hypothetical protein